MRYCKYCGRELDDNAIFCKNCGARTNDDTARHFDRGGFGGFYEPVSFGYDMQGSTAVSILSFLFWEVGLILWFFWRHTRPGKARSAAKGAAAKVGFNIPLVGLVLWLLWKDEDNRDIAKVAGIAAAVGAVFYAVIIILTVVLCATGTIDESVIDSTYSFMA